MADAKDSRLVERVRGLVQGELARLGQPQDLRAEGQWLVLGKGATATRADIGGTLLQWDSLPDDLQQRRIKQIADLLTPDGASGARAARAPGQRRAPFAPRQRSPLPPLLIAAGTMASLLLAYRLLAPQGPGLLARLSRALGRDTNSQSARPDADPDRERALLGRRACDQVRLRISRGASIGPADVEGWQVELVLLARGSARDLTRDPALASFIQRHDQSAPGTWIWPSASSLTSARRFDAEVAVNAVTDLDPNRFSGLRLVFSGPYVAPYFSETQRADYLLAADALADALSATDGALYAHCAGDDAHAIGSWFLGPTPGGALSALVYFMAAHEETQILKPDLQVSGKDAQGRTRAFELIGKATTQLDRAATATLIGHELGMISGRAGRPSRLTYPFRDANRAARSSVEVARALGLLRPG